MAEISKNCIISFISETGTPVRITEGIIEVENICIIFKAF